MSTMTYDIFYGRIDGWHTYRAVQNASREMLDDLLLRGWRIETEHQIGIRLSEVYLTK
jgi:hypothetical protein